MKITGKKTKWGTGIFTVLVLFYKGVGIAGFPGDLGKWVLKWLPTMFDILKHPLLGNVLFVVTLFAFLTVFIGPWILRRIRRNHPVFFSFIDISNDSKENKSQLQDTRGGKSAKIPWLPTVVPGEKAWDNTRQGEYIRQDPSEIRDTKADVTLIREHINNFKLNTIEPKTSSTVGKEMVSITITEWHDRLYAIEKKLDNWLRHAGLKL